MNCNCEQKAIVIVRNNDTDWNGGKLATINLVTDILDLSNFTATLNMSGVIKTYDDLSSGSIEVNLSAQETKNLPPRFDGILNLIDNTNKVATIESLIPFKVISQVHGNAIATEPYTLNFDVKQGGETILTVNVESAVTVEVGTTTTLPAGADATVTNVGTDNHLILDFGIPQGIQGEKGERGGQGIPGQDGQDGQDAKINGVNTLSLTASNGLNLTQAGNNANISGATLQSDISDINSLIPTQATTSNQLADKNFVNSSIATNTANFIGTFNSVAELEAYSGTLTNNDYAFVVGTDSEGNTVYDRYKYNADTQEWIFEYELNNSSFTAQQWASINSGITSGDVALINTALQPNDDISELNNDAGFITGITSSDVTTALGYTPYNSSNPSGYISGITSSDVTTALGYTPQIAGNYVTTDTVQEITGRKQFNVSDVTDTLVVKRANSTTAGTAIRFENNKGVLGGLGYSGGALPYCTGSDNASNNIIVRCGSASAPAVGNTSTPVYIDTDGITQECTGVQQQVTVTTISSNDSITLADNTCFKGGSISAFTITVPSTDIYPFVCEIDFTSPSTATTITYSGTIVWDSNSDDLINDVFVPATNKDYTIMFWFNGTNYCGTVTGV